MKSNNFIAFLTMFLTFLISFGLMIYLIIISKFIRENLYIAIFIMVVIGGVMFVVLSKLFGLFNR